MKPIKFEKPYSSRISSDWYTSNFEILPVRVKDIILDSSHPEYNKYYGPESIGAIKYSLLDRKIDTNSKETLPIAFPANRNFTAYPLKDEVVLLVKGPKFDLEADKSKNKYLERVDYYLPVVGVLNQVNYIGYEDSNDNSKPGPSYSSEESFIEKPKTRPIRPFNGDVILQGRNGQSIRFTGATSKNNPYIESSNSQSPLTIISNGHPQVDISSFHIEDINKDKSSIYLTENHTIPLKQSKLKYGGARERPVQSDKYKGAQILVSSGRLFFNSHTDDIQFTATSDFGVSAKAVYIDGEDYISLDAKKIYLGEKAKQFEKQPVILGDNLEFFLQELLTALGETAKAMTVAKTIDGKPVLDLNFTGPLLTSTIQSLKNQIKPGGKSLLKSDTTFTE
jgi:hypothetical protein